MNKNVKWKGKRGASSTEDAKVIKKIKITNVNTHHQVCTMRVPDARTVKKFVVSGYYLSIGECVNIIKKLEFVIS